MSILRSLIIAMVVVFLHIRVDAQEIVFEDVYKTDLKSGNGTWQALRKSEKLTKGTIRINPGGSVVCFIPSNNKRIPIYKKGEYLASDILRIAERDDGSFARVVSAEMTRSTDRGVSEGRVVRGNEDVMSPLDSAKCPVNLPVEFSWQVSFGAKMKFEIRNATDSVVFSALTSDTTMVYTPIAEGEYTWYVSPPAARKPTPKGEISVISAQEETALRASYKSLNREVKKLPVEMQENYKRAFVEINHAWFLVEAER
jgi:hypothetical protein